MNFGYHKLYIGGELIDAASGDKQDIICPASNEIIATIAWTGEKDAQKALESAQEGFSFWSKLSLSERTEWMRKLKEVVLENDDLLRKAIMYEMGKPYEAAWEDVEAIVNGLDFYPGAMRNLHDEIIPDYENTHRHKMVHQPAGVAVAYLAWNFPLLNVGFKIGPALAAGCSIVIKPSDKSPLSAYVLGKLLHDIDFPPGVINILCGPVEEVASLGTGIGKENMNENGPVPPASQLILKAAELREKVLQHIDSIDAPVVPPENPPTQASRLPLWPWLTLAATVALAFSTFWFWNFFLFAELKRLIKSSFLFENWLKD